MGNLVYKEAVKLAQKLLDNTSPTEKLSPIHIFPCDPNSSNMLCYDNHQAIDLLVARGVIKVINDIKNVRGNILKSKVSFRRNRAENFLHSIIHGDFAWDKRYGIWGYKNASCTVKPGTGQYKLVDMFMNNPDIETTDKKIIEIYGRRRPTDAKRTKNDLIEGLKKLLKIPKEYFIPTENGYIFRPIL
jgi:hypothetical protein